MPAILGNSSNFLLTTDFPLDKVVYLWSGSINLTFGGTGTKSIATGLGFNPLPSLFYSTTSDFSIAYESESSPADPNFFNTTLYNVIVAANGGTLTVTASSFNTSAVTIYFRVYCFVPSNINPAAPPTAAIADAFQFSTDYNYTKLFKADVVPFTTSTTILTINHNLGYVPQISSWIENSGNISPNSTTQVDPTGSIGGSTVTSTTLTYAPGGIAGNFHYRIYLDT